MVCRGQALLRLRMGFCKTVEPPGELRKCILRRGAKTAPYVFHADVRRDMFAASVSAAWKSRDVFFCERRALRTGIRTAPYVLVGEVRRDMFAAPVSAA